MSFRYLGFAWFTLLLGLPVLLARAGPPLSETQKFILYQVEKEPRPALLLVYRDKKILKRFQERLENSRPPFWRQQFGHYRSKEMIYARFNHEFANLPLTLEKDEVGLLFFHLDGMYLAGQACNLKDLPDMGTLHYVKQRLKAYREFLKSASPAPAEGPLYWPLQAYQGNMPALTLKHLKRIRAGLNSSRQRKAAARLRELARAALLKNGS